MPYIYHTIRNSFPRRKWNGFSMKEKPPPTDHSRDSALSPYPFGKDSANTLPHVGGKYFLKDLQDNDRFSVNNRNGIILDKEESSILVRWESFSEDDWEGNKIVRNAYNQRIAPTTMVTLLKI